jgi:competence protein ComEC
MNVVVISGFAAVATGWAWLAGAAGFLLGAARQVAGWHAGFEPPVRLADPPAWLVAAFLLSIVLLWVAMEVQRRTWRPLLAAPFLACLGLLVTQPFEPGYEPAHLEVTTLDVGQGDGLLVASPRGRFMLVDAGGLPVFGNRPTRAAIDIGEDVVSPYLFHRGIRQVDVIIATHAHEDHIGGLRAVVENFRPRELWTGAFADSELLRWVRSRGVKIVAPRAGEHMDWDGVQIEVLSPPAGYEPGPQPRNNDSLVVRLTFGARSILLTGDVEQQMEYLISGPADVLKVAHHGSRTSTTEEFLDSVHPRWAVISAGFANLFRHPHPQILDRLAARGVPVWRTDEHGQVRMLTDGKGWRIEPFHRFKTPLVRNRSAALAEARTQARQSSSDRAASAR